MEFFSKNYKNNPVNSFLLTIESKFTINTYYSRLATFCDFYFKTRDFNFCDWSKLNHTAILQYMGFCAHPLEMNLKVIYWPFISYDGVK